MKLNEIISLLEENYDEIDVFDHINAWSQETAIGYRTFALCTFFNKEHNIAIQTMVYYPVENETEAGLNDSPIYETYIGYNEDPENKINRAFRIRDRQKPLDYSIFSTLEADMDWITVNDEQEIPEEEIIAPEIMEA